MKKKTNKNTRKIRVRARLIQGSEKPRLTVFRSNRYIYAQIIDDVKRVTLVDTSSEAKELHKKVKKTHAALEAGKLIAKKALEKGIKEVAFDRGSYRFHGRVKQLADGAREGGLKL